MKIGSSWKMYLWTVLAPSQIRNRILISSIQRTRRFLRRGSPWRNRHGGVHRKQLEVLPVNCTLEKNKGRCGCRISIEIQQIKYSEVIVCENICDGRSSVGFCNRITK